MELDTKAIRHREPWNKGRMTLVGQKAPLRRKDIWALGTREFETFCCLYLDNRRRLIEFVELFRGTIDGASVHPREVVKEALKHNAAAVIFAHPHPSSIAEASVADEMITRRLKTPCRSSTSGFSISC